MPAIGAHQRREVGVEQVGARDPPRIVLLLMHPDRAVAAVIRHDHDHPCTLLRGGAQLVHRHLQAAVAGHADHRPVGMGDLGRDRRRQAVAHRPRGRRNLRPGPLEAEIAVHEGRIIARPVGQDRVLGQVRGQPADHLLHPHRAGGGLRRLPGLVMRPQARGPVVPAPRCLGPGQRRQHRARTGGDAGIGAPQMPDLVGVGIDMDDPPPLRARVHQLIARGQRVPQPRAQRQDAVGRGQRLAQPAAHPDAQIADIVRVPVVHVVLAPERHRDRQPPALGKGGQPDGIGLRPQRAAGHHDGPLRPRQRLADRVQLRRRNPLHRPRRGRQVGRVRVRRQHVLGQRQHHRAGAAGLREIKGAGDIFGNAVGLVDLGHPLGQPAEHLPVIDLLKRLAVAV